jgi:TPR repeat protein
VEQGYTQAVPALAQAYLVLGQQYEKGEGVLPNQQAALRFYTQAAALGNKRAVEHLAKMRERTGDLAGAAQLRELFARGPEIRAAEKLPVGFNLDPGKDEQRERRIRVAGTAQAASASMAADAFEVIFWIPPRTKRAGQP